MSLTVAILMMTVAWLVTAAAMLWGVLRIARRHQAAPAPRKHRQAAELHAPRSKLHAIWPFA
jgi:hypothetical protein